jgi:hypothetical protein
MHADVVLTPVKCNNYAWYPVYRATGLKSINRSANEYSSVTQKAKVVTLPTCIQEVTRLNLGGAISYPD